MTKEEALQKVNDYCNEKSYTNATLTDGFKDKFAEHFAKRYPDAAATDETAIADMKFALNTAFSGASLIITEKTNAFTSKENDYKKQIEELQKKVNQTQQTTQVEIPDEIKARLAELDKFKDEKQKQDRFKSIVALAKNEIRQDLHSSFDEFAKGYEVKLDKEDKEQSESLLSRFRAIFKDSIGDIKPFKPQQEQKKDEELIGAIPKVKVC